MKPCSLPIKHFLTPSQHSYVSIMISLLLWTGQILFFVFHERSAAFDIIDHEILLRRIETRLAIGEVALMWVRSYLAARTQKVMMINYTLLTPVHLPFGIPRWFVLGPLLFSIYTLPIGSSLPFDHNNPSVSSNRKPKMERRIVELRGWITTNKLKLNGDKRDLFLILSSPFNRQDINVEHIQIGSAAIRPASSVCNLFCCHERMRDVVRKVFSTAYCHLRNVCSIRRELSHDSVVALIHTFVSCRLDY